MSTLLRTEALRIEAGDRLLCTELNLEIRPGEFWCVIGKNGAGKSTLLHTLAGLRSSDAGTIFYASEEIRTLPLEQLARRRGLLAQQQYDAFPIPVLETVLAGRHPYQSGMGWDDSDDIDVARTALHAVDMAWAMDKDVTTLSGGERQRVALATLLAQAPQVLLLDEPTAHQDVAAQLAVMGLVKRTVAQGEGRAAIAACHDINLVARHASHVLALADGQHWSGTTHDVLKPEIVKQVFDCSFHVVQSEYGQIFIPAFCQT